MRTTLDAIYKRVALVVSMGVVKCDSLASLLTDYANACEAYWTVCLECALAGAEAECGVEFGIFSSDCMQVFHGARDCVLVYVYVFPEYSKKIH